VGTFHSGKGDLHGITVVVDTRGPKVFVGRCDTVLAEGVVLLDGDVHDESAPDAAGRKRTKAEYLRDAARFGVWKRYDRHLVPAGEVTSVTRLGEHP
jgi:hypothetical protein